MTEGPASPPVRLRVLVRLKPGIMDVQGTAVQRALVGLGFSDLRALRIGKVVELEVEADSPARARGRAEAMCRQLLANPVIEDYAIEAVPGAPRASRGRPRRAQR